MAKNKKNISECFSQKDISKEKIIKIILICNSEISAALANEFDEYKKSIYANTELELIPLDTFTKHIPRDYPSIARKLGITIDAGQILEVEDFIGQYENHNSPPHSQINSSIEKK